MTILPTPVEIKELKPNRGLDAIYNGFDEADCSDIDLWLNEFDPDELSTQNIIGVLSITMIILRMGRGSLDNRKEWVKKAEAVINSRETDSDRLERLLEGLR